MPLLLSPAGGHGDVHLYALPDGRTVEARATDASPEIETVSLSLAVAPPFPIASGPETLRAERRVVSIGKVPVLPGGLTGLLVDAAAPARLLPALARATGPGALRLLRAIAARVRAQAAAQGGLPGPFAFGALRRPQDPAPRLVANVQSHVVLLEEADAAHHALLTALDRVCLLGPSGLLRALSPEVLHPVEASAHARLAEAPDAEALAAALAERQPRAAVQALHDAWAAEAPGA